METLEVLDTLLLPHRLLSPYLKGPLQPLNTEPYCVWITAAFFVG